MGLYTYLECFFFNDTATTEIYTLSLHDALPIFGGSESEIVELVPGERIVLHWQFVGPDRTTDPAMTTRLTVTFTPTPDGTHLDLTHDRLDGLRDRYPHIAEHVEPGWESALDKLVTVGW